MSHAPHAEEATKTGTTAGKVQNENRIRMKPIAIWQKLNNFKLDEGDNTIAERERENPRIHTRMGIPRHKKRPRESTQQRTRINAHANLEIHYNINNYNSNSNTRKHHGIPPKSINTQT